MLKKSKLYKALALAFIFSTFFNITVFAVSDSEISNIENSSQALEDAKTYLTGYSKSNVNRFGKEYVVTYSFDSDKDLDAVASYIAKNGIDKFNEAVEIAVEKSVNSEPASMVPQRRTPSSPTIYRTISKSDGLKSVSGTTYGLCDFGNYGTVEYSATLGYNIRVQNGTMQSVTGTNFNIPYISSGGNWGNLSFPTHCTGSNAGVTANYDITKTISIPIGNGNFDIVSKTDDEFFAVLTSF